MSSVSTPTAYQCSWCHRRVTWTPMRAMQLRSIMGRGKIPNVFCGRECSTAFYNKITNEKRKAARLAKRMDGI